MSRCSRSDPGVITANTKPYLYLDPTKFLSQVPFLWNPTVALGTVTHEYIGYLLPMGPFFALTYVLHIPTWIAQRLWLGSILFVAGVGILYLCRTMRLRGPGPWSPRWPTCCRRISCSTPAGSR